MWFDSSYILGNKKGSLQSTWSSDFALLPGLALHLLGLLHVQLRWYKQWQIIHSLLLLALEHLHCRRMNKLAIISRVALCKSLTFEAMVRGYHVYKEIWLAAVGEELSYVRKVGHCHNLFVVAVVKSAVVVIHVPRKILSICSLFLRQGGTINCRVTGGRHFWNLPQGGLEIPCTLMLWWAHSNIDKVKMLLERAFSSNDCAEKENKPPKTKPWRSLPDWIQQNQQW